jgi:D-serine deaminase-like pyridoxal phosphate-dependent protein
VRPIQASVSSAALRHNYAAAQRAARGAKVYAVVKANAYGHGLERVTRALVAADGFGTVELEGAIATRERASAQPILLLEGFFEPAELPLIEKADLGVVIHSEEQLRMLETTKRAKPLDVFFKINTGMNRLGFALPVARRMLERLQGERCREIDHAHDALRDGGWAPGHRGSHAALQRSHQGNRAAEKPRQFRGNLRPPRPRTRISCAWASAFTARRRSAIERRSRSASGPP